MKVRCSKKGVLNDGADPIPRRFAFSLRLGHAAGLTVPRTVIQYRVAATLPLGKAKRNLCFPVDREATATVLVFSEYPKILKILYHILIQKSIDN